MKRSLTIFAFLIACIPPVFGEQPENQSRIRSFSGESENFFTEFSKGQVDISLKRNIWFDVNVNLETGLLRGKWQDNPQFEAEIFKVAAPGHLWNAEVLVAQPLFSRTSEGSVYDGYYFVVYLIESSKPGANGRGNCGAGSEDELLVLLADKTGAISSENRYLVSSCIHPVGSLFVRDIASENIIYVIYKEAEILNLLKIDYLYPKKGVEAIRGNAARQGSGGPGQ